jgi:hypothetical protein
MNRVYFLVLGLALLWAAGKVPADVLRVPQGFIEKGWYAETRDTSCELRQDLPLFGVARFVNHQDDAVQLMVDSLIPVRQKSQGQVYSKLPNWKGGGAQALIGEFSITEGGTPVRMPREMAMKVFYALYEGRDVFLEFDDLATGERTMLVRLSPIDFLSQVFAYEDCIARLHRQQVAGIAVAQNMIDEDRVIVEQNPDQSRAPLRLKPMEGNTPALSYQFDEKGRQAPIRLRVP